MGQPYSVQAGFPVQGLAEITPYADQEAGTSSDLLNVVPFDVGTGRLRGGRRPGTVKMCTAQVSGSNAVQCVVAVNATYVEPVLGDSTAVVHGNTTSGTEFAFASSASGTLTDAATTYTFLGATFGPPDNNGIYYCYVVEYSGTTVYLSKYTTDGARVWSVTAFTATTAAAKHLCGLCADEDTVYVWYSSIALFNEGIMRFRQSDGGNVDAAPGSATTEGCWIRSENASHTEKVFGGVRLAATDVFGDCGGSTNSHPCMRVLSGKLAVAGAPYKSGGTAEFELVLYIIDLKTGIVDAVVDLGVDGTVGGGGTDHGMFVDLEFGLDGFAYVLIKDVVAAGTNGLSYIRKVAVTGTQIWQIVSEVNTERMRSLCWNNQRRCLIVAGDNLYGTGLSVVAIDPDSKGIVDAIDAGSVTSWDLVRSDGDGNIWLWANGGTLKKLNSSFGVTWSATPAGSDHRGCCLNSFFNTGTDEAGSTRLQYVFGVSNGVVKRLAIDGVTANAVYNPSSLAMATNAQIGTIYSANFGVLTFFADGHTARYLDSSSNSPSTPSEQGELRDWAAEVRYGKLPQDTNGGFTGIEVWNKRVIIFGVSDDPSNWYMSARGDPFDWKIRANVANAAISGRTGPVGLFPEKITAVIPYNDDFAIFGGDSSIYQLSGDPAVDGVFDLVSENIGIAPGRAWCRDGFGGIFFVGNNGGVFKLSLDQSPQRVTTKSIDARLDRVDVATSTITMAYDVVRQGIWILIRPSTGGEQECYFLDLRTEGWFPIKFAATTMNPRCVTVIDLDSPKDQKILMGNEDGYVRYFRSDANTDDGQAMTCYFVVGPWVPRQGIGGDVTVRSYETIVGGSGQSQCELMVGRDSEDVITHGKSRHSGRAYPKRTNVWTPWVSGSAVALKVTPEYNGNPQFEGVRMELQDGNRII